MSFYISAFYDLVNTDLLPLFAAKKVAQKPRGDNFRGHPRKFPKTDAVALLLREKVSVF
jgi:hypothetical protein